MPPFFSVAQCQAQLQKWYDASAALAEGKSVTMPTASGGMSVTRVSAEEVEKMIVLWENRLAMAQRGASGPRIRLVNPL